jgi:hypothetical protein
MFIEFETVTEGHMMLNVKYVVRVKRHQNISDSKTEIILANGDGVTVIGSYQEVCDSITRLVEDFGN